MNVILGLCHSYSGNVVTLQESFFDKTPDLQKCGVLYQVTCPQCQHLYVGETGRTLATRMKDHTSHNTQPTAVGDHCREHGHVINKNNVEVLDREEGWFKRKIREAIEIKTLQPTINRGQGFDLPAIYSEILPVSVTRDRSRQTSGHPAQAIGAVASSSQTKETRRLRKLAFTSKKRLLQGNNFSTVTIYIHPVYILYYTLGPFQALRSWNIGTLETTIINSAVGAAGSHSVHSKQCEAATLETTIINSPVETL